MFVCPDKVSFSATLMDAQAENLDEERNSSRFISFSITIAAAPKHLGARIGLTAVLHSWGSALTHHPHVHIIVPGGGISLDGQRWISCRPGFSPCWNQEIVS